MSSQSTLIKSEPKYITVAISYEKLAQEKRWLNENMTIFPISMEHARKYVELKSTTCSQKSLRWYINNLAHYHKNVLNINWKTDKVLAMMNEGINENDDDSMAYVAAEHCDVSSQKKKRSNKKILIESLSGKDRDENNENEEFVDKDVRRSQRLFQQSHHNDKDNRHTQRKRKNNGQTDNDYKTRFQTALEEIQSHYVDACIHHSEGCFQFDARRHLVLTENMMHHWASLVASGDDVDILSPPSFEETPEFSIDNA
ncbi:11544_t:CDS:2, partial [Ambispora gerdemannii]